MEPQDKDSLKDRLLDHDSDGIEEYDNDLPRWWLYGFYLTIVMSVIYVFYYEIYSGSDWNVLWYGPRGQANEYAAQVAEGTAMIEAAPQKPATKAVLLVDAVSLSKGKAIFNSIEGLCFTCHREDLGGLIGPNLTDDMWVHGCSLEKIMENIVTGFPEKGMLPYGSSNKLSNDQVQQVASYIISMRGSNPVDPKPIEAGREIQCNLETSFIQ